MQKLAILYQDNVLSVVDKPCGMLAVPYPGADASRTVIGEVERMMRKRGTYSYGARPLAVHRLDRDTSGVMMIAFGQKWRGIIMDKWQEIVTERLYRAVVEMPHGKMAARCPLLYQDSGVIELPLAMDKYGRTYAVVGESRRHFDTSQVARRQQMTARTHYRVVSRGHEYMLLELQLDTGRKNQIRAHLAALGCPVAGDKCRGSSTNPYGRLALHARTLAFIHPRTHVPMRFDIPESNWSSLFARTSPPRPAVPYPLVSPD